MSELAALHLFGPAEDKDGHLMGAKNGIPMHRSYEDGPDSARLPIHRARSEARSWTVACLYEEEAKSSITPAAMPFGDRPLPYALAASSAFRNTQLEGITEMLW